MSEPSEKKKGFSTAYGGGTTSHPTNKTASDYSDNGGSISLSKHSGNRKHASSDGYGVSPDPEKRTDSEKDTTPSTQPASEYYTEPVSSNSHQKREYKATWDRESNEDVVSGDSSGKQILGDISHRIEELKNKVSGKISVDMDNKNRTLCIIAIAAGAIAFISCFLPLVTISMFGFKESISIMQGISKASLSSSALIFPACSILSLIFAIVSLKNHRVMYGTAITSAIGAIMLVIQMNKPDDFLGMRLADYAGIGYHLYILSSLTAIVLAMIVVAQASGWNKKK